MISLRRRVLIYTAFFELISEGSEREGEREREREREREEKKAFVVLARQVGGFGRAPPPVACCKKSACSKKCTANMIISEGFSSKITHSRHKNVYLTSTCQRFVYD
jgi:hypothetical protein